jgi:hypothetical protein
VEAIESGIFRADLEYKFSVSPEGYQVRLCAPSVSGPRCVAFVYSRTHVYCLAHPAAWLVRS